MSLVNLYLLTDYRADLWKAARAHGLELLEKSRPPFGDKTYWGAPCPECGAERPTSNKVGAYCECEKHNREEWARAYFEEHKADAAADAWSSSGVPNRFEGCRFENFEPRPGTEKAAAAARAWAEGFDFGTDTGLFLGGSFGSGKTHLATAALWRAVERTVANVVWESAPRLVLNVRAGEHLNWRYVERAIEPELLLLDDVGQEGGGDIGREIVARVIGERYDASRPILATSNLGPKALSNALGAAYVSRLHEMTEPLSVTATDFRRKRNMGVA